VNTAASFTAAEIARCLACTPQNVRKLLKAVPADGQKPASGIEAAAWCFGSLPSTLLARLAKGAAIHGFTTPLQFLEDPPRNGRSLPSVAHVADSEIARAQKLRSVLARCLAAPANLAIAGRARIAIEDYRRQFGHSVSDRHLRSLIDRTMKRDGGHRRFDRINLYFSDRPEKRTVRPSPLARAFRFDELDAVFATLRDRTKPTVSEIAYCWREVIKFWDDRLTTSVDEIKLKRELRAYLLGAAPFMGESAHAIKRNLNRKISETRAVGIDNLADGRLHPKTRRIKGVKDFKEDFDLLVDYTARFCYGRVSQGYRELHSGSTAEGQTFSNEFRARFPLDVKQAKSRVPKEIRLAASPVIRRRLSQIRGSRAMEKNRPSAALDWSEVASGDYYSADDVTGNHYVYEFRPAGQWECEEGRFDVGRPQFLITIDERSTYPLGFAARLAKRYERMMIISHAARVCVNEAIGLPHQGWVLEKGPWASNDVTASLVGWADYDEAFLREGIVQRIIRARSSRGKARIENTIGRIQTLFDFGPGFCGRDEKSVQYQKMEKFVSSLKRISQPNKPLLHPGEKLMSLAQYDQALARAVDRYSHEIQNGEWLRDENLRGLSPSEAWTHFASPRAHRVLPESLRFLMASTESKQRVEHDGICIRIGGWKHYYKGHEKLSLLFKERVRVRFDPEHPNYVHVASLREDPAGRAPFSVPLSERRPARSASDADFGRERSDAAIFTNVGRTYYREFTPPTNLTLRKSEMGSSDLRAAGEAHNLLQQETIALDTLRESQRGTIEQLAGRQNLGIDPANVRRPGRVAKHLQKVEESKARIRALEAAQAGDQIL
jgi:hypothetical protein